MYSLRSKDRQKVENKKSVILKHSFNIIFKNDFSYKGIKNKQYCFQTWNDERSSLIGYQQFLLSSQPKMLKKYAVQNGFIKLLYKKQVIQLWKFDHFHNCNFYQDIYNDSQASYRQLEDYEEIQEIGINKNENTLIFQQFVDIYFFKKNKQGVWKLKQTIESNYLEMQHIRFNESEDIIVAYQSNHFPKKINRSKEFVLTIFHKTQKQIWQVSYQLQNIVEKGYPFCFFDDQQFLLFQSDKNIQLIYEITRTNYKLQEKKQFSNQFEYFEENQFNLLEIKSKNLVIAYGHHFLDLQQSKSFLLKQEVCRFPSNVNRVECSNNSELLFFYVKQNTGINCQDKKIQAYSIYLN